MCTRGIPTTCSSRILEGWRPPYDATVVDAAAGRRRGRRRQDQPRRVRDGLEHRELGVRPDPQPARHQPRARRVERRQRRGGRRRVRRRSASAATPAARSASRRRCAASSASSRRTASSAATGSSRSPAASTRSARSRTTVADAALGARGHRRPRPDGLDVDPASRPRRSRDVLDDGVEGLRVGRITDLPGGRRPRRASSGSRRRSTRSTRRRRQDRRRRGAGVHVRPHRLLPDRAGRGVEQPRPLRRRPLRPARRRRRHQRDVHGDPRTRASATRSSGASCSARTPCRPATTTPTTARR